MIRWIKEHNKSFSCKSSEFWYAWKILNGEIFACKLLLHYHLHPQDFNMENQSENSI